MQARRLIIGYLFYICISIACIYIYGFKGLTNLWSPILGYCVVIYFFYIIWSKFRGKVILGFFEYFIYFLYKSAICISIFILTSGTFLYYQNNISPAQLPSYTLSNGDKTLIFQTMSHIGSEDFYEGVKNNVHKAKKSDFVLYYEGVLPGNIENTKDFNKALGINFTPGLYENFSKLYGIQAQDNNDFLGLVNNLDYNIDLSLDEVMDFYKEKNRAKEEKPLLENQQVYDLNTEVISKLGSLSEQELILLRYINQGILNFIMKHEGLRNTIISKLGNPDIFSVILDDRNKHLAQEILTRKDKKIIVLYGLMHFPGVLDLLQSQDSKWKILNVDYSQVIHREL